MSYNVVTSSKIMKEIKKSKYFKVNLGIVNTIDKNGNRILNDRDKFAYFYNSNYKTTIMAQGYIGDIKFYVDYYIQADVLAFYYNYEEFIFDFDWEMYREKGIDSYLGHLIKKLETEYQDKLKEAEKKKEEPKRTPNPDLIMKNPGAVTYDDIKAYLEKQNKNRYSI